MKRIVITMIVMAVLLSSTTSAMAGLDDLFGRRSYRYGRGSVNEPLETVAKWQLGNKALDIEREKIRIAEKQQDHINNKARYEQSDRNQWAENRKLRQEVRQLQEEKEDLKKEIKSLKEEIESLRKQLREQTELLRQLLVAQQTRTPLTPVPLTPVPPATK